jgi:hypothetical protein
MKIDVCDKLVNTYNTNVLDDPNIDPDIRKEFFKTSAKYRNGDKGRKVLMDLIYNHEYSSNKPTAKFIGGPYTLTVHWSKEYQKMIYIFGENHSDKIECDKVGSFKKGDVITPIENYLSDLILNTDVFIDLYIEFPVYSKIDKEYNVKFRPFKKNDRMQKLFEQFKKCLQYTTRSAKQCKLARVHYFDARFEDKQGRLEGINLISWYRVEVKYIIDYVASDEQAASFKNFINYNPKIITLLKGLSSKKEEDFLKFCTSQLHDNYYVNKELDKIKENPSLKKIILDLAEEQFLDYGIIHRTMLQINITNIFKYLEKIEPTQSEKENFKKAFISTYKSTISINAIVSDVYLFSRIFKDFDITKLEEKSYVGATDQPLRAHNIIIYAGNGHAERHRDFLQRLKFKPIGSSGKSGDYPSKYCIDMKTIQQPFFSEWPS